MTKPKQNGSKSKVTQKAKSSKGKCNEYKSK